jgi:hypothetical protein
MRIMGLECHKLMLRMIRLPPEDSEYEYVLHDDSAWSIHIQLFEYCVRHKTE